MERSYLLYNTRDQGYARKHRENPCEILAIMWDEKMASRYTKGEAEFALQSVNKDWEIRTVSGLPVPAKKYNLEPLDDLERKAIKALIRKEIKVKGETKLNKLFESILQKL